MPEQAFSGLVRLGVALAIAILVVEAAALLLHRRLSQHGLPIMTILLIAISGLALLGALALVLFDQPRIGTGLFLAIGGIAHGWDLLRRLRRTDR